MRVLFDQGTPDPLREALLGHEVATVYERGWSRMKNGELLDIAEREGYEVFVTTDSNLKYQQNLAGRQLAIVVLLSTSWPRIRRIADKVVQGIDSTTAGSYEEIEVPE